jgi:hypothetical protein
MSTHWQWQVAGHVWGAWATGDHGDAFTNFLERTRAARAIRPDIDADDLRRYLCGDEAVRLGDRTPERVERDLEVLVLGLRPPDP